MNALTRTARVALPRYVHNVFMEPPLLEEFRKVARFKARWNGQAADRNQFGDV